MSHTSKLLIAVLLTTVTGGLNAQDQYNLSFEQVDTTRRPTGWQIPHSSDFQIQVDSTIHQQGKYSLEIQKISTKATFGAFSTTLPAVKGTGTIKLVGYLKTEDVANGFAGLWMRLEDNHGTVYSFDNMSDRGVKGTTDWKAYTIEFRYYERQAGKIVIGGLLAGDGKAWIDNLQVFVNDQPIRQLALKTENKTDSADLLARQLASDALTRNYAPAKISQLVDLCQIWGFLKYYHPAIGKGLYDWDSTLFSIIPRIITASQKKAYHIEEQMIDDLGPVPPCPNCKNAQDSNVKLQPDYGSLFAKDHLPATLQQKLAFIRDNYQPAPTSFYVQLTYHGGTSIQNEIDYGAATYRSAAIRLIILFRCWNIIHYYFPYRYLIKEDWNAVLPELIPRFLNAENKNEYLEACFALVGHLHDTHANIYNGKGLDSLKGVYITPFQAKFIEGRLVVTNYYTDSPAIRSQVQIGDVIQKIDGIPVDSLVSRFLPLTPASNKETQYRNLAGASNGWLLRSNNTSAELTLLHNDTQQQVTIQRIPFSKAKIFLDWSDARQKSAYQLLSDNIGYINPGKLKENDIDTIQKLFRNTRGIVVDLRCYPSTFMPFTYGALFKQDSTPFVRFTVNSQHKPGAFVSVNPLSNGGTVNQQSGSSPLPTYKGKLVIIVNSITQSQAEYTTMALQTVPGAIVVGSTTAGADGDVTNLTLPGSVVTMYSGLGVYYPDNSETQRVGVRIDVPVHATIQGIREGRDEYLEKAISLLKQ
jgi:C-terminal processing protease CtpA/Prc